LYLLVYYKGYNDTDEEPDEEVHRARSKRVLSTDACPCGVRVQH